MHLRDYYLKIINFSRENHRSLGKTAQELEFNEQQLHHIYTYFTSLNCRVKSVFRRSISRQIFVVMLKKETTIADLQRYTPNNADKLLFFCAAN